MRSKSILIISLTFLLSIPAFGQKNIYSTYSRYGIGELVKQGYGSNIGYGAISSGLRVDDVINYSNPASYTAQDTNSFIFDLGVSANTSMQRSSDAKINRTTAGFDHVAIGFPIIRWWKSSIGLVPLSHVGYNVKNTTTSNDLDQIVNEYEGTGGVRQFYIGNGFSLGEHLSVGFNYFYLFGNTNYRSASYLPQDPYSGQFQKEFVNVLSGSRFQLGLQYNWNIFSDYNMTLGATYDLPADLKVERDQKFFSFYQYSDSEGVLRQDTIDQVSSSSDFTSQYPSGYRAGFTLQNPKLIVGADFKYQNWSDVNEFDNLNDSYSMQAGLEYTPDRQALRNYFKRVNYRLGGYYKQSYLTINNQDLKDYGITFGLGIPLKYNKTKFNVAVQLGRRGTTDQNLIEENYAIINFNITFYDFWFIQQKYQ